MEAEGGKDAGVNAVGAAIESAGGGVFVKDLFDSHAARHAISSLVGHGSLIGYVVGVAKIFVERQRKRGSYFRRSIIAIVISFAPS